MFKKKIKPLTGKIKFKIEKATYSKIVAFVVMKIEHSEKLAISGHLQLLDVDHPVTESLSSELLHLYVIKLTEVAEPLDELRCGRARKLCSKNSLLFYDTSG